MLRSILIGNGKAVKCSRFMSLQHNSASSERSRPHTERLGVTLCGIIYKKPIQFEDGKIIVPLMTKNAHDDFHAKHRVIVSAAASTNVSFERLDEGARVLVTGVINYSKFQSAEGHKTQQGHILSTNIIPCEQNEDPFNDINDVILFGNVQYEPKITENITFLRVLTKYFDRAAQNYKGKLHLVKIMDDEKMREKANCVELDTCVSIHGFLETQFIRSDDGKLRETYHIRPRQFVVHQPSANYVKRNAI